MIILIIRIHYRNYSYNKLKKINVQYLKNNFKEPNYKSL